MLGEYVYSVYYGQGALFRPHVGLISADTGADTWKKQALHHMPGWRTLAKRIQTRYHARVIENTCKQGDELVCSVNAGRRTTVCVCVCVCVCVREREERSESVPFREG